MAGIDGSIRFALDEEDADEIVYVEEPGSDNPFFVYEREGQRCLRPRCGGTIARLTQGGRSTYWCTRCQT